MGPIRILLAEDHHLVREGLRALLEEQGAFEIVAQAEDGAQALTLAAETHPDVVVMDLRMPNLNGLEATGRLRAMDQPPEVIILSQYSRADYVVEALLAGARGYLLKDAVSDELVHAIQTVLAGQRYLSAQLPQDEIDAYVQRREQMPSPLGRLTAREREVLQMVAEGNTNRQVARRLGISVKTVEKHRFNLMEKLDIRDVTGLVRFALMHGIISDEP